MVRKHGMGMGAFFDQKGEASAAKGPPPPISKVRMTLRLAREEADLLDLLRIERRKERGRSVTYGDVLGEAVRLLARKEGIEGHEQT